MKRYISLLESNGSYLDNKKIPKINDVVYFISGQMSDKILKGKVIRINNIDQKGLSNTYIDVDVNNKSYHINIQSIFDHKPKRVKQQDEYGEITVWE